MELTFFAIGLILLIPIILAVCEFDVLGTILSIAAMGIILFISHDNYAIEYNKYFLIENGCLEYSVDKKSGKTTLVENYPCEVTKQ